MRTIILALSAIAAFAFVVPAVSPAQARTVIVRHGGHGFHHGWRHHHHGHVVVIRHGHHY